MLTAARSTDDLVAGLALGADDYLPKPFRFAELVARLRALARRSGAARPAVLEAADVVLDPARRTATRAGRPLDLTPKELAVLEVLLAAQGAVVTPEELVEKAWDEQLDPLSNTVRMTVMTLRRKLGDPPLIATVRGSGYRV
jgi:DNA-binding response OmpR family regulator